MFTMASDSSVHSLDPNGLDLQAAKSWIYPTNYPLRDYQYNIVQNALFNNTLVSLPTGLGKTFIAAVIMYNYFRWYPTGKVIFMAPTRPLVKQQIDACYDIMGIPKQSTIELTGYTKTSATKTRSDMWLDKRVFFITPQILQNDLDTIDQLATKIKCIVFDEAHRARGNYAYCLVIQKLLKQNKLFRVLALSATPGKNVDDVQEIIRNLLISRLEFRIEESLDVQPYVFKRELETLVVQLCPKIEEIRGEYIKILEYYTKPLVQHKVIQGNCATLTKGKIFMIMKNLQNQRTGNSRNYGEIMKNLNKCITLYHAYELLVRHGLRSFLIFFDAHIDKPPLNGHQHIRDIMENIRTYLGPQLNVELLPDGSYSDLPKDVKFGHPKFYKLRDILIQHFSQSGENSRVIVFFEYRESVIEAHALLLQTRPLIRPRIFLGQKLGVTQRTQINVVKAFREGTCNTLLSTCIGEEGLDVGDVDLIVCFDISTKSPIRMVQRMGRTGRKRSGKVIVLVTEGKEQQTLKDCLIYKNNVSNHVLTSTELKKEMYKECPRMIPSGIEPECQKLYITVEKATITKESTLKSMFKKLSSREEIFSQNLEVEEVCDRIGRHEMVWNKDLSEVNLVNNVNVEKQRMLQQTYNIVHSKKSEILVSLLQSADSKRYNIPTTQKVSELKQADIRNMFTKATQDCSQKSQPKVDVYEESGLLSRDFFVEVLNFVTILTFNKNQCKYCPLECKSNLKLNRKPVEIQKWASLDTEILANITASDLKAFRSNNNQVVDVDMNEFDQTLKEDLDLFTDSKLNAFADFCETSLIEERKDEQNPNRTVVFTADDGLKVDKNRSVYEVPKNFHSILEKSMPREEDGPQDDEVLSFFNLDSVEDFFKEDVKECKKIVVQSPDLFSESNLMSPILFESERKVVEAPESPILCSFLKRSSQQVKRNLTNNFKIEEKKVCDNKTVLDVSDICDLSEFGINLTFSPNKRARMSSDSKLNPSITKNVKSPEKSPQKEELNISDICDLSEFGIGCSQNSENALNKAVIEDICDLSSFGLSGSSKNASHKDNLNVSTKQTPVKSQICKKSQSQATITQMISLVNKSPVKSRTSDDFDDFDLNLTNAFKKPGKKCIVKKPMPKLQSLGALSSDEEFEIKPNSKSSKTSRKTACNVFVDDEAAISDGDCTFVSQDEPEENLDCYEASFVADEPTVCESTQMIGKYLESVKSPARPGMFKIPTKPRKQVSFIYSQPEDRIENDTYLEDSFVVHEDDENIYSDPELSELEILEQKLKKRKKPEAVKGSKRKRIIILSDDSD